jgi:hypothetical protein
MKFKAIIFIIVSIGAFLFSCQKEDTTTLKKFKILASSDASIIPSGIHGFYIVDGGDTKYFAVSTLTSGYYTIEQNLETPDTLQVSIDGDNKAITSIQLLIYDDTDLVKSVLETPDYSGGVVSLSCYYEFSTSTSASASK